MHFYSLHYSTSKCPVKYKKEKMAIVLSMNTFVNHITMMELQQHWIGLWRPGSSWNAVLHSRWLWITSIGLHFCSGRCGSLIVHTKTASTCEVCVSPPQPPKVAYQWHRKQCLWCHCQTIDTGVGRNTRWRPTGFLFTLSIEWAVLLPGSRPDFRRWEYVLQMMESWTVPGEQS